jgi:hypothetical protein
MKKQNPVIGCSKYISIAPLQNVVIAEIQTLSLFSKG